WCWNRYDGRRAGSVNRASRERERPEFTPNPQGAPPAPRLRPPPPGCASRPWAVGCNRFAVTSGPRPTWPGAAASGRPLLYREAVAQPSPGSRSAPWGRDEERTPAPRSFLGSLMLPARPGKDLNHVRLRETLGPPRGLGAVRPGRESPLGPAPSGP